MLLSFKDSDLIKIVTGVRRCGKSTLLELYQKELIAQGISEQQIQFIRLEALENESLLEYHKLYEHIVKKLVPDKKNYCCPDCGGFQIRLISGREYYIENLLAE